MDVPLEFTRDESGSASFGIRCRTGITITEAGSILASRGLALLSEAGAIREELANDPAGRVVVGMPAALR